MECENWKEVKNYPAYEVSTLGRVRDKKRRIILKQGLHLGYPKVGLRKNNKDYAKNIHRLVAETFLDQPEDKPHVDHINGDRRDSSLCNLRFVSHRENMLNRDFSGRRYVGIIAKRAYELFQRGKSLEEAIKELNYGQK